MANSVQTRRQIGTTTFVTDKNRLSAFLYQIIKKIGPGDNWQTVLQKTGFKEQNLNKLISFLENYLDLDFDKEKNFYESLVQAFETIASEHPRLDQELSPLEPDQKLATATLPQNLDNILKQAKEYRSQIEEIKQISLQAAIVAADMASQIERRFPYRRVMKQTLSKVTQNKEAQGVKVMLKGRLNGAEIARREWLKKGKIPLQTLRSNIDYAQATAYTTYGTIGVKVWIYKGEVF